jgi:predicted flap endonuclease-1-like 5' DNA nuclease
VAEPPLRLVNPSPSVTTPTATEAGAEGAGVTAPTGASDASALLGRKVVTDDLKIVEGIGPKIAELLHVAGIGTWSALAACDVDALKAVLADGGSRFRVHDPSSWPQQAALAAAGDWAALTQLQDALKGGRAT